jgi:hypothetical protein
VLLTKPHATSFYSQLKAALWMCQKLGVTQESKKTYLELLGAKQTVPSGSLFDDDIFERTCTNIEDRNETRVIRDISSLIVPSAETFATYGAKGLDILIESTNEGWNNSIPVTGTRPQPDYSVGFKREAFMRDQLDKLSPFLGNFIAGTIRTLWPRIICTFHS